MARLESEELGVGSNENAILRKQLLDAVRGHQAHIEFDAAVEDFPPELQRAKPPGVPHSAWQLLEHLRIAQNDILEFSRNPKHQSPNWPEGYWPKEDAPPHPDAWAQSVAAFKRDAKDLSALVSDPKRDLFEAFPHGEGQNLLREALLVASHNSYHLGQLVFLKKMLFVEHR
ncbi:MAG: DinB family protein [Bryobacteraceae bacterium]